MAIRTIFCAVAGNSVVRVSDFEGATVRIICAEYEESTRRCRLKRQTANGGPLARFLERASEDALASRSDRCDLA